MGKLHQPKPLLTLSLSPEPLSALCTNALDVTKSSYGLRDMTYILCGSPSWHSIIPLGRFPRPFCPLSPHLFHPSFSPLWGILKFSHYAQSMTFSSLSKQLFHLCLLVQALGFILLFRPANQLGACHFRILFLVSDRNIVLEGLTEVRHPLQGTITEDHFREFSLKKSVCEAPRPKSYN